MMENNGKDKSQHILNASSNLLGICFIVLTSLKFLDKSSKTVIDEVATVAIIFFMASCIFSFLSIRGSRRSVNYEHIADIVFISGLVMLFVTAVLFSFNLIN